MIAQYILPTTRYDHGILGDQIEAAGLAVSYEGKTYEYTLPENQVFEDILPRLYDLDGDHIPEILTILTNIEKGASVAVFTFHRKGIELKAQSAYIGRTHRWLNIAAIDDFDFDGIPEIAWVTTPHIGGSLKFAHLLESKIVVLDSMEGVTNHKIGSSNQDLSLVRNCPSSKLLYLPTMDFTQVYSFKWSAAHKIVPVDTIDLTVDPLIPLKQQLIFN